MRRLVSFRYPKTYLSSVLFPFLIKKYALLGGSAFFLFFLFSERLFTDRGGFYGFKRAAKKIDRFVFLHSWFPRLLSLHHRYLSTRRHVLGLHFPSILSFLAIQKPHTNSNYRSMTTWISQASNLVGTTRTFHFP